MLAVDLLELLGRLLGVLLLIEQVETLVVELVGGLVGNDLVGVEQAAAGERHGAAQSAAAARQPRESRSLFARSQPWIG